METARRVAGEEVGQSNQHKQDPQENQNDPPAAGR
ncbi:hypothetical protein MNBD_PLANCTO03-706 [hydrothermal vent metagenome]|uniref:Uncharacterized protein n=1 Tax=hydrothermal vent metagenome TaxID=652676 RepID=A0A3B1E186_9ZZZZ